MYHILTHPTTFNYGGILQAYALQRVLFETEYNADTIEYNAQGQIKQNSKGIYRSIRKLLASFCSLAGICNKQVPFTLVACFHQIFKKRFVRLMPLDNARHKLSQLQDDSPFIVGSDQVWRGQYARPIESLPFFFLDFATQKECKKEVRLYAVRASLFTWWMRIRSMSMLPWAKEMRQRKPIHGTCLTAWLVFCAYLSDIFCKAVGKLVRLRYNAIDKEIKREAMRQRQKLSRIGS